MSSDATGVIQVILAHEHRLLRDSICCLINTNSDMRVVGAVNHGHEALQLAGSPKVDVVILNLPKAQEAILESIPTLTVAATPKVLMFAEPGDSETTRLAIRLGASGVVHWDEPGEVLIKAVRRVHASELWLNRSMTATVFQELRNGSTAASNRESSPLDTLSPREQEIVTLVAQRVSTRKLAERLYISEKTVRNHLTSIYAKLGISDRVELALFAIKRGLTQENIAAPCKA